MIPRHSRQEAIKTALGRSRAVMLVGPRQVGKTTLAREFLSAGHPNYFDLEDPVARERLSQPKAALERLKGLVVIDEVQHAPDLFQILRVLIDRDNRPGQFLLLGSASPRMLRQAGESLLGRVEVIEIEGFGLDEVGIDSQRKLWIRGGFPPSFTAQSELDSLVWRKNSVARLTESDLRQLGINVQAPAMLRFWMMLTHGHGQIWNAADPARSLGISEPTVRRYLDWLTQAYMVRQLQPWHENIAKRQVKAPKIYFRDSGMLHALMNLRSEEELLAHPRCGASWEGFALEQVLRWTKPDEAYFWATHAGAELDLLMFKHGRRIGMEFKRMDAPRMTPSMGIALETLRLDAIYVVYPGDQHYSVASRVHVVPLSAFFDESVAAAIVRELEDRTLSRGTSSNTVTARDTSRGHVS